MSKDKDILRGAKANAEKEIIGMTEKEAKEWLNHHHMDCDSYKWESPMRVHVLLDKEGKICKILGWF